MTTTWQAHHERIIYHAFRIKHIVDPDSKLIFLASTLLEHQGLGAVFDMLQKYADGTDLDVEFAHLILTQQDGANIKKLSIDDAKSITNCLIDISDVINFFLAGHKTVSGIQRLVIATLACMPKDVRGSSLLITMHDYENSGCRVLPWDFIDALVDYISSDNKTVNFNFYINKEIKNSVLLEHVSYKLKQHTLLILGAAWIVPNFPIAHRLIAKKYKLQTVSILYDLIPYTYPDFVSQNAAKEFYFYIISLLSISDIVISISQYVSNNLSNHFDSLGEKLVISPSNQHIELAREIPFKPKKSYELAPRQIFNEELNKLGVQVDNFVLNIGSIEIRKNHIGLFVAWRHLLAQMGSKCPQLVVVGRSGWKAESFLEALRSSNNLDGKLIVLHGIGDALLSYLYEICKFTVYPSHEEGWGLPIGESLDAGKLCITSNRASMPEVGKELCLYINPAEPLEIAKEVEHLINNPELIRLVEQKIADAKPLKSWLEYNYDLANLISTGIQERSTRVSEMAATNYSLTSGQVVSYYWHLEGSVYDLTENLTGNKRSLKSLFPSRLITTSKIGSFEVDGAWCMEPKFAIDCYIDISLLKSNFFSVSFHYLLNEAVISARKIGITADITFFSESATSAASDLFVSEFGTEKAITYTTPDVDFVSSDLITFNFSNIDLISLKANLKSQNDKVFVPIKIEIHWNSGFKFKHSKGKNLEPIKIREISIDY